MKNRYRTLKQRARELAEREDIETTAALNELLKLAKELNCFNPIKAARTIWREVKYV